MPSSNPISAIILAAILATGATGAGAGAEERCSGTLCDFYYGGSSPAEQPGAKPAAPTPLMVPSIFSGGGTAAPAGNKAPNGAAPATPSRVQVQGGGLLGMLRGQPAERCTGTLCDFYYGGSPPEKPETASVAADPQAAPGEAAATDDAAGEGPHASRGRVRYEAAERETKPRCAATAQDPWRCYR